MAADVEAALQGMAAAQAAAQPGAQAEAGAGGAEVDQVEEPEAVGGPDHERVAGPGQGDQQQQQAAAAKVGQCCLATHEGCIHSATLLTVGRNGWPGRHPSPWVLALLKYAAVHFQ